MTDRNSQQLSAVWEAVMLFSFPHPSENYSRAEYRVSASARLGSSNEVATLTPQPILSSPLYYS